MKKFKLEVVVACTGIALSLAIASCASGPYAERKVSSAPEVSLKQDLDPVPECRLEELRGSDGKCSPRRVQERPLRRGSNR